MEVISNKKVKIGGAVINKGDIIIVKETTKKKVEDVKVEKVAEKIIKETVKVTKEDSDYLVDEEK